MKKEWVAGHTREACQSLEEKGARKVKRSCASLGIHQNAQRSTAQGELNGSPLYLWSSKERKDILEERCLIIQFPVLMTVMMDTEKN